MNEQYKRLVNAIFPDDFITSISIKTNVGKIDVEHICIEIIARVLGDGSDLSKKTIEHKIKKIVENDELKALLLRLQTKYNISSGIASKVLGEMLPSLFKRVVTLDNSLFVSPVINSHPVQYKVFEETKPIEELKKEIEVPVKQEPSVDDVFKNIEHNVEKEEQVKQRIEVTRKQKQKKSLFSKKPKKEKVRNEVSDFNEDEREITLIEKICIIVVLVALVALIGTIVFLVIKQKMSM